MDEIRKRRVFVYVEVEREECMEYCGGDDVCDELMY